MADLTTKAINTYGLNDETLGLGHKILIVGDSVEYLTLVSDIAKKIVEDYAGSTLLGQAQSVASAFSKTYSLANVNGSLPANTNLNTLITEGIYSASNAAASSSDFIGVPDDVRSAFKIIVERCIGTDSQWFRQTIIVGASTYTTYRRYTSNGGSTWSAWEKMPTRSELPYVIQIPAGATVTLTVPTYSMHFMVVSGNPYSHGMYIVSRPSTSNDPRLSVAYSNEQNQITITAPEGAKTLSVVNAHASNNAYMIVHTMAGNPITAS